MKAMRALAMAMVAAGAAGLPAGVLAAVPGPAKEPAPPFIRVTGESTVQVRPNQAQIDIGVVTQAPTAQAAASQNARQLEAVLAALRAALGPAASLRTAGYSLTPMYRPAREGAAPAIVGYTATNAVRVLTDDLGGIGRIVDAAMQAGANSVQRLEFLLRDQGAAAQAEALRGAAIRARTQAEALAGALGLKVVRVVSATAEGPVPVRPLLGAARAMAPQAMAAPTPVEPGTIDVHAEVTLTVEVAR